MVAEKNQESVERPILLGGGPLNLGDPNDRRLRKTESDIIIPKLIKEEAEKKCVESFKVFLDCAKNAGLLVTFKCREENNAKNDCLALWCNNPELREEVTNKYLEARSHYRRTGESLIKYVREKKSYDFNS